MSLLFLFHRVFFTVSWPNSPFKASFDSLYKYYNVSFFCDLVKWKNFTLFRSFKMKEMRQHSPILQYLTHSHTMTPFDVSGKEAFWKHCGKRRNCLYKQFLLYPQYFLLSKSEIIIFVTLNLSSVNAFNLVLSKILSYGNGLTVYQTTECLTGPNERICRQHFQCYSNHGICLWHDGNHCGKRLPAFSYLSSQCFQGPFSVVNWLIVLRFDATLTAKVISLRSVMHCVSWLSYIRSNTTFFQKPLTTFLTCLCRGERENTPVRNFVSIRDQTHNHQVMSQTCSPLSHQDGASGWLEDGIVWEGVKTKNPTDIAH